jgi:broad specificity phosphatase PhoE
MKHHEIFLLRSAQLRCSHSLSTRPATLPPEPPHPTSPLTHSHKHSTRRRNKSNQFTGWTDVDLTAQGVEEATAAGKLLLAEVRWRGSGRGEGGKWEREGREGVEKTDIALTHCRHRASHLSTLQGYEFDVCYTSVLKRAIRTLW